MNQHFVCPTDHSPLVLSGGAWVSSSGRAYPVLPGGKVDFLGSERRAEFAGKRDFIDQAKSFVKNKIGRHYILLVNLIAPVMPRIHWQTFETYWVYIVKKYSKGRDLVVQIGSGNERISSTIVNIDIFNFPEVDILADCTRLPYADSSVDGLVNLAVLEHVADPEAIVREAFRVLRPGGFMLTGAPFMCGFHASPQDYFRWTHMGLEYLHRKNGFDVLEIVPITGPTSGFLWLLQEWLAILLSFSLTPLYYFWLVLFYVILCPVKLLDNIILFYKDSFRIASSFLCIAIKPDRN